MAEYIEREFNPCDVCDYKRCSNCILHELAMKFVGHPATDVAPVVHGRWEESVVVQTDTSTLYDYTCSECSIVTTRESNYCPNCGADMKDGDTNG